MERRVVIGCDIGKKQDPSCVVVTEQVGEKFTTHDLGRLPLGLDYGEVARRIGATYHRTVAFVATANVEDAARTPRGFMRDPGMDPDPSIAAAASVWVLVDSGGVGEPVVDGIRERAGILEGHLMGVQITGGTSHTFRLGAKDATVSKQYLVSQLKRLTGFDPPLLQLPRSKEAKALAAELAEFEMNITDTAHPQWGAAQGKHDDMIMALALSTLPGAMPVYFTGNIRYA
jgi:hypothetical protein